MATFEVSMSVYDPRHVSPFLSKLYEIVDDPSTNDIISWGPTNRTFIVWNHNRLSNILFKYFSYRNFSSFGRDLYTYNQTNLGILVNVIMCFNKVDQIKWEFAHETGFVRGEPHLMMNILPRTKKSNDHSSNNPRVSTSSPLLFTYPKRQWKKQELARTIMNHQDITASSSSYVSQSSGLDNELELGNINRKRKLEELEGTLKKDEHVGGMMIMNSSPDYDNIVWEDIPHFPYAQENGNNNIVSEKSENNVEVNDDRKQEEESVLKMWERFLMETD